jgi:dipeptidyl aminopeptidase/acylaminoacyl peptidase
MTHKKSPYRGLIVSLLVSCSQIMQAHGAEPIPIEDFFRNQVIDEAVMSPSGKYVAATLRVASGKRLALVIYDTSDLTKTKAISLYRDGDIVGPNWVNDDRLIYALFDYLSPAGEQTTQGVYAIAREGGDAKKMRRATLESLIHDGSDDVVFRRSTAERYGKNPSTGLIRVRTIDQREKNLTDGAPDGVHTWTMDILGRPRIAVSTIDSKSQLFWRTTPEAPWKSARQWETYGADRFAPQPIAVDNNNRAYIVARHEKDADTTSLYRVEMNDSGGVWTPVVSLKGFDFTGNVIMDNVGRVLGFRHLTDAHGTTWLDPTLKSIQADVDKQLPGTINRITCGNCAQTKKVLVSSWSDRQPPLVWLYDTESKKFDLLGNSRPWIKPKTMAQRQFTSFTARDGMPIPVHVTRPPASSAPAPMVILAHGGPWVRGGVWSWDAESQFLASRGYVVVEPEFRGSTGFGSKHFRAGWKQWGLAMQDDLADAAEWAVKQGYADKQRICIAGASYGGYAAPMGLVRHGDLYKCGISWAGVTDIDLMYTSRWSNLSERFEQHGMPKLIGDQDKDAKQLNETSPLKQARKIQRPVLMAHGGEDCRVPEVHAISMRRALESNGTPTEYIYYKDEGHGWVLEANHVDFWSKIERFLAKHIGTPK